MPWALLVATLSLGARAAHAEPSAPSERVAALLARMTLEEKAGQLWQLPGVNSKTGPKVPTAREQDVRQGRVGSFLNVWGAETTRKLQQLAVEKSRLHVPLLFAADVIHGFRTTFPVPLAETASFDVELAQRCARAAAVEASAAGVHWSFAPMVDIARDARWGRVVEGSGEDPYLGAAFAVARVRGFQEAPAADATSLLATAKHFVAYGAGEAGREYNTVEVTDRSLHEVYLPPFRAALEAGAATLMPAFNEIGGVPMHAHAPLLRDLLRGQWGFDGIVVSDYTAINELLAHGIAGNAVGAGLAAFNASVDIDMVSSIYVDELPKLVRSGKVSQAQLDAAVVRVLAAKERLGLFDDPYRYHDAARERARTLTPELRALAREAGGKSIVLLKNEAQLLPLKKDLGTLAVVGALAADARSTLGSWEANGHAEDAVTVLDGIKRAVSPSTRVVYARGASPESTDESGFADAERAVREADATIVVVGETEDMSGEAHSRSSIALPGAQEALLRRLHATGKRLVVMLMNGRPLALPWVADNVPAILETWFLGVEMGNAAADVLFGDVNPSAKLPMSFPRSTGQAPLYYNAKRTGRPPLVKERYTSKYIDVPWTPQFPFGHGLSYTSFQYGAPRLSTKKLAADASLTVTVQVKNSGKRAGDEVVQLYLRDEVGSTTRPIMTLRGFARVSLKPGEARDLTFTLDQDDLAVLDAKFARVLEPGMFTVLVGGSSGSLQSAQFELTQGKTLQGPGSAIPRFLRRP
ncbi:MAG TPA: glycoside hydrolase family 3 N-terminal domain-containing protein [Polyangiales bacterium]